MGAYDLWMARLATSAESQEKNQWVKQRLLNGAPPFAFIFDGKPSASLLPTWTRKSDSKPLDHGCTQHTAIWTDPKTGLEVRCIAVEYSVFPAVEWTIYFRNTGKADTPILQCVQALDTWWERAEGSEFVLRGSKGDTFAPDSYEPYEYTLGPHTNKKFTPVGGRPTNGTFPYYNLQMPGGGVFLAVGWPGQWVASFTRDAACGLHVTTGQELTHLFLHPGEEIRTPLVALLFWKGLDPTPSQNVWRRWMLAHNLPRPNGKPLHPLLTFLSVENQSEATEKSFIDVVTREKIQLDYWWMDAGWYPCNKWSEVGTWDPDPKRFPNGIKAVSDYLHARGIDLILWFEPERVSDGSWLAKNHPGWILGAEKGHQNRQEAGKLLNLGNPDAWNWLVNHVDKVLTEQRVDLYRQDFNIDPLGFWRANDAEDRQGITEIRYVTGYLAFWDELRRRHPNMLIDSCASGGRRNDLETLRRSVPLLRSDFTLSSSLVHAAGNQGQTYGLSSWIPYYGHIVGYSPQLNYNLRSYMCPAFNMAVTDPVNTIVDWGLYRHTVDQWRQVASCFLGDYYPLTPYSLDDGQWIAWQFDRPEQGDGLVQAFRRNKNEQSTKTLRLFGLTPFAQYEVTDLDLKTPKKVLGQELMECGLPIVIAEKPGAVLIKYQKL